MFENFNVSKRPENGENAARSMGSSQIENLKLLTNRNVDDLSTVRNAQSKNENGLSRIFGTNFEIST